MRLYWALEGTHVETLIGVRVRNFGDAVRLNLRVQVGEQCMQLYPGDGETTRVPPINSYGVEI